jgi:hypothetical protein
MGSPIPEIPIVEWFQMLLFVAESVTFVMFILEEAIQSGNLSAWMLLRAGKKTEARECIMETRNWPLYFLNGVIENCGNLAPYSVGAFQCFAHITDKSLRALESLTYW